MITILAGLSTAILLWWLVKLFARTSPEKIARLVRQVGGGLALVAAALLALRGRLDMAFLVGSGGAWLLGWSGLPAPFGGRASAKSPGRTSRVRSATVEMELDHDTGQVRGRVLAGTFAGQALDGLSAADLLRLRETCLGVDPEGARLVEAYLDRRQPGWREDAEADPNARGRADPERGAMTEEEAHEILGLQPGAGPEAVRAAHRSLMKKLHPDQGGSTYLATRVNQAKDALLNRHR